MTCSIFVDADACPVKDEVLKVGARHKVKVTFVANQWLRLAQSELIEMILAPQGPDEADDKIVALIGPGDICLSADIPLADRCLKKGAHVLNFNGKPFTPESIGSVLATRDLMTHLRDSGEIEGGGNKPFSPQDRSRFLSEFNNLVQKLKR